LAKKRRNRAKLLGLPERLLGLPERLVLGVFGATMVVGGLWEAEGDTVEAAALALGTGCFVLGVVLPLVEERSFEIGAQGLKVTLPISKHPTGGLSKFERVPRPIS
jgi:hypothetical protein